MTLTFRQKLDAKEKTGTKLQTKINCAANIVQDYQLAKELALVAAEASHAELPQYEGEWDDANFVMVRKDITTKGGLQFLAGDYAIATESPCLPGMPPQITVFSVRTFSQICLNPKDVKTMTPAYPV